MTRLQCHECVRRATRHFVYIHKESDAEIHLSYCTECKRPDFVWLNEDVYHLEFEESDDVDEVVA